MEKIISKFKNITNWKLSFTLPILNLPVGDTLVLLVSILLSTLALLVTYKLDLVVAYNDARAHMNMARLVVDNLNPGLAQIGSVWLPFNHILTLTLVWNDWLWRTGIAGAVFSMISYVLATLFIYRLINLELKNRFVAFLGSIVFATNLNILYMQSTPMTELLLICLFVASTYYFYKWVTTNKLIYIILTAVSVFLATLTRYDGWFLLISISALILIWQAKTVTQGKKLKDAVAALLESRGLIEGRFLLFFALASFGVILWLLWNQAIFGDPLYFAFGPYSANSQQLKIEEAGSLHTKHNLPLSILAYWWAMVNNAGFLLLVFSIVGLFIYIKNNKISSTALVIYTLLIPLVFHVVSLYLGHSIMVLPELGVQIDQKVSGSWFNVRYGLVILPAVAFFSAYMASRDTLAKIILIILLFVQPLIFLNTNNVITITDGILGTSSLEVGDVAEWLKENAPDEDELILTSIAFNNALAFSIEQPLKRFIHEGTGTYWEASLQDPAIYADWVVMANGDVGDPVYNALVKDNNQSFLKNFELEEKFEHLNIYRKRKVPEGFVYVQDGEFEIDGKEFKFIGVNSYDLIYRSHAEIDETLSSAKSYGIDVIRFWAFGDGIAHGSQPNPGEYNERVLRNLDYILSSARQHDIKLIPVFINYWGDYGGIGQYLSWVGLQNNSVEQLDEFYTNSEAQEIYRNYINEILTRKNTITGALYASDNTIFAWELMNEPRSATHESTEHLLQWATESVDYIKSLDNFHLVLIGNEGFLNNSDYTSTHTGPSFIDAARVEKVQGMTAHYYIQNVDLISEEFEHPAVKEWSSLANVINKPLIIEEVGYSKDPQDNNGVRREIIYKNLFDTLYSSGVQGVLLWNWALAIDDSYGISPKDSRDEQLLNLISEYSIRLNQ